jgi:hypothetical protein
MVLKLQIKQKFPGGKGMPDGEEGKFNNSRIILIFNEILASVYNFPYINPL